MKDSGRMLDTVDRNQVKVGDAEKQLLCRMCFCESVSWMEEEYGERGQRRCI